MITESDFKTVAKLREVKFDSLCMTCVLSVGLAAGVRQRGTFIGKTAVMKTPLTTHMIALLGLLPTSSVWVLRPEGWCRAPRQGPKVLTACKHQLQPFLDSNLLFRERYSTAYEQCF